MKMISRGMSVFKSSFVKSCCQMAMKMRLFSRDLRVLSTFITAHQARIISFMFPCFGKASASYLKDIVIPPQRTCFLDIPSR
uniref:Uncharacterized protein n=1 Tax=Globodera rostochiensis TaxID=31243 RepID=A0A914HD28_GLORO